MDKDSVDKVFDKSSLVREAWLDRSFDGQRTTMFLWNGYPFKLVPPNFDERELDETYTHRRVCDEWYNSFGNAYPSLTLIDKEAEKTTVAQERLRCFTCEEIMWNFPWTKREVNAKIRELGGRVAYVVYATNMVNKSLTPPTDQARMYMELPPISGSVEDEKDTHKRDQEILLEREIYKSYEIEVLGWGKDCNIAGCRF